MTELPNRQYLKPLVLIIAMIPVILREKYLAFVLLCFFEINLYMLTTICLTGWNGGTSSPFSDRFPRIHRTMNSGSPFWIWTISKR